MTIADVFEYVLLTPLLNVARDSYNGNRAKGHHLDQLIAHMTKRLTDKYALTPFS